MTFNIPEKYVYIINALMVALIAWFAALSVGDAVRLRLAGGASSAEISGGARLPFGMSRSAALYEPIVRRDIFNLAPAPESASAAAATTEDLSITLLGTSHLSGGIKPFAIIEDAAGGQTLYRLGETIPNAGRLLAIGHERIVVLHNGHRVAVAIPRDELGDSVNSQNGIGGGRMQRLRQLRRSFMHSPMLRRHGAAKGIRKLAPNHYAITRSTVNDNVHHMAQLFTEMRATPNFKGGKSTGFRLSEIQPGSVFEEIGLRDGDVLTSVSGHPVSDPAKALQLLSTLDQQSSITLSVIRNGTPMRLSYTIH